MYDASRSYGISERAEPFVAGVVRHMPALTALTAPSIVSYFRLRPNRWAPVWANLAERDRGLRHYQIGSESRGATHSRANPVVVDVFDAAALSRAVVSARRIS